MATGDFLKGVLSQAWVKAIAAGLVAVAAGLLGLLNGLVPFLFSTVPAWVAVAAFFFGALAVLLWVRGRPVRLSADDEATLRAFTRTRGGIEPSALLQKLGNMTEVNLAMGRLQDVGFIFLSNRNYDLWDITPAGTKYLNQRRVVRTP